MNLPSHTSAPDRTRCSMSVLKLRKTPPGSLLARVLWSLLFVAVSVSASAQTTYYSRQNNADWNTPSTWSTTSHSGASCGCIPGPNDIVRIGGSHDVRIPQNYSATAAIVIVGADNTDATLTIGYTNNSNNPASLTIAPTATPGSGTLTVNDDASVRVGGATNDNASRTATLSVVNITLNDAATFIVGANGNAVKTVNVSGDIIVSAGTSFTAGGNGGSSNNINLGGNLVNSGTFNMASATDASTVTFNGSAVRTLSGSGGTFIFRNFTLNAGGNNLEIRSSIRIEGTLNFAADGLLVVDSNGNIVLDDAASISGANNNRYVQLDGATGANSQLVRVNGGDDAHWEFLFPVGTATGGYTPLNLTVGSGANVTGNPDNNSTLAVKVIYGVSAIGKLRRTFRLRVEGNDNATTFTNADFSYNVSTDVSAGDVIGNYSTIWQLESPGGWSTVGGTAPGAGFFTAPSGGEPLSDGTYYYTIGISTAYPSVWYSYQNGVWSNPDVWTLDPSGTTLVNPFSYYPSDGDEVVILNGFTVTSDVNGFALARTTIEGGAVLDMAATTGNSLGAISGTGLLRVNGTDLPSGNYSDFVASTGGTIEYYNTGGVINTGQTAIFNNLLLSNSTGSNVTFTTDTDIVVNGDLNITQTGGGATVTWEINDNSELEITLNGDLTVSAGGRIRANGNEDNDPHELTLYGNLTNAGSIKFFDGNDTELNEGAYNNGDVFVNELQGNAVNVMFRGVNQQTITCNGQTDFYRLIVDKGTGRQSMLTVNSSAVSNFRLFGPTNLSSSGATPNVISNNALSLVNGTLQLTGSINIPNLCTDGSAAAGSDYLSIPQNAGLWINGAGVTVTIANNNTSNDDQRILIDGLMRISAGVVNGGYSRGLGAGNSGGVFLMEGGTLNVWQFRPLYGGNNIFSYIQSGGVVNIATTGHNGTPSQSGVTDAIANGYARFSLPQSTCSFEMSGGTMNIGSPTTLAGAGGWDVQSSGANYNVTGGTINFYITTGGNTFGVNSTAPLYDVNVYKTGGGGLTATLNQALTVLNNLTIISGNTPTLNCSGNNLTIGGTLDIQSGTTLTPGANTITFNGSGAQGWIHNGTITSLNNVVVSKSAGTLTLGGAQTFPNITGGTTGLTLTSGTLDDGGKTITVTGAISNSATHTGSGAITLNGAAVIGGNNGTFGNLTIATNNTVATAGKQSVTGTLRLNAANTTLNIGSHNFAALGNIYSNAAPGTAVGFTGSKRIRTNGLHNDGGLTRQATSGTDLLFPVGTTEYTPATINVTAATAGTITVRPVASAHPNVTTTAQSVRYYWRVESAGFTGITSVVHKAYTYAGATRDASSANYRPARYDGAAFSWGYSPTTYNANSAPGTTRMPDFNTGASWIGTTGDQLDGDYTAGNSAAFQAVTVYYSRASGNWGSSNTWSNVGVGGTASSGTPCQTCPVVIGDGGANNHTVTINANSQGGGSLFLAAGSTLDCGTFTNLNFGLDTKGTGTLRIGSANFPAGDFLSFLGSAGGTVQWYGATKTIPTTGPGPMNLSLATYFNLVVSPNTGQTITLPATNVATYNNFTVSGTGTGQVNTNVAAARVLTINGNLIVSSGTFQLSCNSAATSTSFVVEGNTTINSGASMLVQNANTGNHNLTTNGSIINNGTVNFRRTANRYLDITFSGPIDAGFGGTNGSASTTLSLLTLNKGTSQTPRLTFDVAGTLNALTNNWLTLSNGNFIYNRAGSITLTDAANNPYTIPSTARLTVQNGTVNISAVNNSNSDLLLAGSLEVAGGTLNINSSGGNNDNDIEYAAAGTPTILVSAGTLYVNGSIRRSTVTLSGALSYIQTGGTVTVGGRAAAGARGVFEIENYPGSQFTLTGNALLQVLRSSGGSAFADLYLNPQNSNVAPTGTIEVGANTLGNQTLSINVMPEVGNFTVMGAAGNTQTVNMVSSELNTTGTLTINQSGTLQTNSLDVNIGGDLSIVGTYNGSNNTTTFNGSTAQAASLSATSTFLHMTVDKPAGTVTLSGTSPTITNLNILNGILDVSTIGLTVTGDVVNNSSQVGTGSITLSGASAAHTITSNGGSFTNLTLGTGSSSKVVSVKGNLTINGLLNFAAANRFLNIAGNRLVLGTGSAIAGAGSTAFIRTNGVSSDLGVVKNWATGNATFTYPVGTMSNYTPVGFTLNVTSAGTMTVIPVNGRHPSYNFTSTEQILNYYWIVSRGASLVYETGAPNDGPHTYSYPAGLMGGSGGSLIAGYLNLSNPTGWVTNGHGGSATSTLMTFTGQLDSNLPGAAQTFHYTVGTALTLAPVIEKVYSRFAGGNWTDLDSWTTDASGTGPALNPVQFPAGPVGTPVVILSGATIVTNLSSRSALSTEIYGTLDIGTTVGHDFGVITGDGTLRTGTNTFPGGDYTAFVSPTGGTIEYVAPTAMNSRSTYNHISITGTGTVTMTNTDITVNGNITIDAGATLSNVSNNADIALAGHWTNSGTFSAGIGTLTFNGPVGQNITGMTTFHNFTVSKPGGNITLLGTTRVNGLLTLTQGHIISTSTELLYLSATATLTGGGSNSFVSGPVRKLMLAGSSFSFPLGSNDANRYRPARLDGTGADDTWTLEYVGNAAGDDGYNHRMFNTANLGKVSGFEYWNIYRAGTSPANVTLSYNTGSYAPPDIGNVGNLRIARWNGTQWDLPPGAGVFSQSGNNVAGTVTVTNVTSFGQFTHASLDQDSPLPVELLFFKARVNEDNVLLSWSTAQEKDNHFFTVQKTIDFETFHEVGTVTAGSRPRERQDYSLIDHGPFTGRSYYRLKQTDIDGKFSYSDPVMIQYDGPSSPVLEVYPNPFGGDVIKIELSHFRDETGNVPLKVFNQQGQVIAEGSLGSDGSGVLRAEVRFSTVLQRGVYILKIANHPLLIRRLIVN